jgi:thiamine biosynthesis lipoprotein
MHPPGSSTAGDVAGADFRALGTSARILVTERDLLDSAAEILRAELAAIDEACSRFREDSELSRLNRSHGEPTQVGELLCEALAVALDAAEATSGDVDPTCGQALIELGYDRDFAEIPLTDAARPVVTATAVPGWRTVRLDRRSGIVRVPEGVLLDLGATAKALAADRTAARVHAALGCGVLVNLGGDIAVAGRAPDGGWRVRVTDDEDSPADGRDPAVAITSGGLATSGTSVRSWQRGGRRVHHIVAPRTGRSAEVHWRTATVAGATCVAANIAATAAIVRGATIVPWLEELRMPARLVRADGSITCTGPWPVPGPRPEDEN